MSVQPAMPPPRAAVIPLAELEILEAEQAALHVQHIAIGERILEITRLIMASGEAALRQQREAGR